VVWNVVRVTPERQAAKALPSNRRDGKALAGQA